MGAILGFLKSLYEHKEKIVLAALVIAFITVGYFKWWKVRGAEPGPKAGQPDKIPTANAPRPEPEEFPITHIGNSVPVDTQWAMTDERIFIKPVSEEGPAGEEKEAAWPTIVVRSIFDATNSKNFIAIMEINGKRAFKKEGEVFLQKYEVRRIDGVRNCLTIVKHGSKSGEEEREFCKEN